MRQYLFPSLILTLGLLSSQIFFSVVVYLSNNSLLAHLTAIHQAGYLVVPNFYVMQTLKKFMPAFCGALFFSLTTGTGLTLLSLILILFWRAVNFKKSILFMILILWAVMVYKINVNGVNISASVACVIIPLVIAFSAIKLFPKNNGNFFWIQMAVHGIILSLILLAWFPVLNKDTFISFRDYLLLGNPIGQKINDFYYAYTMYPAEVFKSDDQKLLKTCHIQIQNNALRTTVEKKLCQLDYLKVYPENTVDLSLKESDQRLKFFHDNKLISESTPEAFLADPEAIILEFSKKCDHNAFFRKMTFVSLVIGLPILFYILLHAAVMLVFFFLPWNRIKFCLSALLCLVLGVALSLPLYHNVNGSLPESKIVQSLSSNNWRDRTAALKIITDKNFGIDQYMKKLNLSDFQHIPERYWLANALSTSLSEHTYKLLLEYLNDPNPNVVCMALYSLGKRNQRNAIDTIISKIKSEKNWYIQWYAYKALKRMGWEQTKPEHLQ